jgi:hypothetical protein
VSAPMSVFMAIVTSVWHLQPVRLFLASSPCSGAGV